MTETVAESAAESSASLSPEVESLKSVIESLLTDLYEGRGDRDNRRQVEEWLKALADKYPELRISAGLRKYYVAEAGRLKVEFDEADNLSTRLEIGRSVESYLARASEIVQGA